ncbi:T-lymphocyte surface antigen Ly-9-like isoform X2 [Nycticebus coucang]|uniref:T-lymphocyte surface antigen Ly-9-like isoform X2 n=1 Tax=Nycticebus coucang TaxID=9470 RepID=UPI00234DC9DC|nr:T-lymphocyte surface antigen Ly-9-like isoform X2 [Nycticebus coucang]
MKRNQEKNSGNMKNQSSSTPQRDHNTSFTGVCSAVVKSPGAHGPGVKDSRAHTYLEGIQGGAVLFHVTEKPGVVPEADLEKLLWSFGPESGYIKMFEVSWDELPRWVGLQEKLKQRVHVPNLTSLRIENLTLEDSGQYRAEATLTGGKGFVQVFHLMVYEPVPHPHIQAGLLSLTSEWCNATLECNVILENRTSGTTEDLKVTWKSRELEQGGTPGPALNSWTLAVSLPLSQLNTSFTCVVSNRVDQKTATKDFRDICAQGSGGWDMDRLRPGILGATVVLLLILEAGLYLWNTRGKKRKKKLEPRIGAGLQEEHRADAGDVHYADLIEQEPQGIGEVHVQEKGPLKSVYSEVRNPGQIVKKN